MFPWFKFFKDLKISKPFSGILLLLWACIIFYLDLATKNLIAFDIFYFPSIMLAAWILGKRPGFLMAFLTASMWFIAQEDITPSAVRYEMLADGTVHLITFVIVAGMTGMIRKREVLLEEKSMELARSNVELEQFAFKAAHDIQSPLATILGYAELLHEKYKASADAEANDFFGKIFKNIERMKVFIKALLDYSRVMRKEATSISADLGKVVKETLDSLHATVSEKKAEVICDPLPVLSMNPGLAGLLFQNLIGNAVKYCETQPRVHISAVLKGKEWMFSVKDNGIGIPPEAHDRIFNMFEKLKTQTKYPGSGIGLATCQKIVERYHGRIWVESVPGEGSAFYFTLPVAAMSFP